MAYSNIESVKSAVGSSVTTRAITHTLYVSPSGNNQNGNSWSTAYQTIQAALDAASTDADDCTLILVGTTSTFYDIDTTGDPTWTGNYEIRGTHRRWAPIINTHASATSVFKFTGKVSIKDLAIMTTGTLTGVIFTNSAFRIRSCGFNSSSCTGANTSVYIDGTAGTLVGGVIESVRFVGNVTHSTALKLNNVSNSEFERIDGHACLIGLHILHASSSDNFFNHYDIGGCATGIKIDDGTSEHFTDIYFHENTLNINDLSGDANHYLNIQGEFEIRSEPQDRIGVNVVSGANAYGADTELVAAASITNPFKVIAYSLAPSDEETMLIRFSADSGATYFTESVFSSKKDKASGSGDSTDFIFNAGARISASLYGSGTNRNADVWLEIQEI